MSSNLVCAGIDIGGTNSEIGLVDKEGRVLFRETLPTKNYSEPDAFIKDAMRVIREGLDETDTLLRGIGIGAPSANYYSGSIEHAPNMPWKGIVPLAEGFMRESGQVSVITNDANAAALGEQLFGAAKGLSNFVVVTLGTGLGSGFVVNDQVLYGHDGFAGELGHVIIEKHGRLCGCGRKGCLETYVSATGIVLTAKEMLANDSRASSLRNIAIEKLESRHIAEAAKAGDELALDLMERTGEWLGLALANMMAITSPSHIFFYGGLAKAGDLILAPTKKYFNQYVLRNFAGKAQLQLSGLPEHAAVLGAAALAWKETSKELD